MLESLWSEIIKFTSQFILPDWGSLISLLPALLLIVIVVYLIWTWRRFAVAGPARRASLRVAPLAPASIHMPGPSYAPIVAAIGAFFLFWGLVVGGVWLWFGVAALVVGLLYWGREALTDFDQLVPRRPLPDTDHEGPPPGVHMPGPSFRPLLASLGTFFLFLGLVFGGWLFLIGIVFLVVTLLGWLSDARREYAKTVEADRTGHLETSPAPAWPRTLFWTFAVLFAIAVLIDRGVILHNPSSPSAAGGPPASGAPAASGGAPAASAAPSVPAADLTVHAKGIAFDTKSLEAKAAKPFTIAFANDDPAGVPHDIVIRDSGGNTIREQPQIDGGKTTVYTYDALDPGSYVFICSVHPIPAMTGTLTVK
jgi:plastocyanin